MDTSKEQYLVEKLAGRLVLMNHIVSNRFNNEWLPEDVVDQFSLRWDRRRWEIYEEWKARKEAE